MEKLKALQNGVEWVPELVSGRGERHRLELVELLLLLELNPLRHVSDGRHHDVCVSKAYSLVEHLKLLLNYLSVNALLICIVSLLDQVLSLLTRFLFCFLSKRQNLRP